MKNYDFSGLKLLVVDDEELLREILVETFVMYGAEVDSAEGGDEALQKVKEKAYDILLTDVRMPNGDGINLIKTVNGMADRQQMKIFVCSAYNDLTMEKISELRIAQMINKPFDIENLLTIVGSKK